MGSGEQKTPCALHTSPAPFHPTRVAHQRTDEARRLHEVHILGLQPTAADPIRVDPDGHVAAPVGAKDRPDPPLREHLEQRVVGGAPGRQPALPVVPGDGDGPDGLGLTQPQGPSHHRVGPAGVHHEARGDLDGFRTRGTRWNVLEC